VSEDFFERCRRKTVAHFLSAPVSRDHKRATSI
jgi:hypothetical protein